MSASTAKTIFQHEVVVSDATTGEQAGLVIGTGTQLGTLSIPAAGLIGYDVAKNAFVAGVIGSAGTNVARPVAVPIASGIIAVTGANTFADVTIPTGVDFTTHRMTSSLAATAGAAAAATAPVFTKTAATTLRCTVTAPGGAEAVYVSYEIYATNA